MKDRKKPAIRFKGFTEDWEQRKLGDIFKEYSEKDHEELPALMIIQGGGTMSRDESDRSLLYDKANLANYKMVKEGDFIVHLRSFEGGLEKATNTGIISPAYHTLHGENTDSRFYYSYFRSKKFIDVDLKPHVYGIRDGRSIDIEGMKTVKIPFTNYREQKTIGTFIKQLDRLITLHQRKYDKLVNVKKSMLEKIFPKNGESIPDIRFSGFTEDWEQRKLGEMMEVTSVKRILQSDWADSGIRFLRARDIVADQKNEKIVDPLYISKEKYDDYSAISGKVKIGDLLVTGVGTIGASMLIKTKKPLYFKDGNIIWFKNENKIEGYFFYYSFNADVIQNFIKESAGIGTVGTYTIESGKKTPIYFPLAKEEQEVIGTFFSNLDNLITLHQRKLEKLKNIKKSCLEKMFI
ncbi:restriction endonuclease subunit S [Peptostreptococcus stomatis]